MLFQLTLEVPTALLDKIAARAEAAGLSPVVIEKPHSTVGWVEVYAESDSDAKTLGAAFARAFPVRRWEVKPMGEQDWSTFWRHHFKPHAVGSRIWVTPLWEKKRAPKGRDVTLVVNPGLSFGTGDHFTTRFCLEALDGLCAKFQPRTMLDAGCGSAILSVAAVKLGCPRALALDHDPLAVNSARENLELNGVAGAVKLREMDLMNDWPKGKFDIVCANLFGEMLMQLARSLVASTRRYLVLSGIRTIELDAVETVFGNLGLNQLRSDCDHEWAGLIYEIPRPARRASRRGA